MIDWELLKRLRANFLSEEPGAGGDYWNSRAELESYDATFAERIGWKWDAVLGEAKGLGWAPAPGAKLLDWGCGTGIAARRFVARWPNVEVLLWDRSARAMELALERIPGAKRWDRKDPEGPLVLLASHVLNELESVDPLLRLAETADTLFWVEPGTPTLGRKLIEIREQLREKLAPLAPCPHSDRCGLIGNPRHWCHHFAPPPPEVFTSSHWRRFGKELGIDLRSLPVSYLVMSRSPVERGDISRVIGRARIYKGYALPLVCRREGVREEKVMTRNERERVRQLERGGFREK